MIQRRSYIYFYKPENDPIGSKQVEIVQKLDFITFTIKSTGHNSQNNCSWKILWDGNEFGKKSKVIRVYKQPPPVEIMIGQNNGIMWNISAIWVA